MAKQTIFYSWQSDLPNSINRGFIEDCLQRAIKELQADDDLQIDPALDRDTSGVPGSPDIAATIFDKISAAEVFVADVTFIDQPPGRRRTPNPNVLVELGYAAGRLGWDKIICVFNRAYGEIDDLPFDIRPRRVRAYELREGQEKADRRKVLVSVLKDDIKSILHAPDKAEAAALQDLLSSLASQLIGVIILSDELGDRRINPWLDAMRSSFGAIAGTLRQMATTGTAIKHLMVDELEDLANTLDEVAHFRLLSGCWPEFSGLVGQVSTKVRTIKASRIDGVPLSDESLHEVRSALVTTRRRLNGLASRAEAMVNHGRFEEVQSEASEIGLNLLRLGHYAVDAIHHGLGERLRSVGGDLHLVETIQVLCDGGKSVRAIVDRVQQGARDLCELVDSLTQVPER